jgi:putative endonuclease
MYFVYVLKSETRGIHYVGYTENIERRLMEHNLGLLGKYTKGKGPWILIFQEEHSSIKDAMKREKYFKTGVGREFLKKNVIGY